MPESGMPEHFLARANVEGSVFELPLPYRALLVAVGGLARARPRDWCR